MIKIEKRFMFLAEKKFENIYTTLEERRIMSSSELFSICVVIGYINNKRLELTSPIKEMNRQIESVFLKKDSVFLLFSVNINLFEGVFLENLEIQKHRKTIEEFAHGGIVILCNEVFNGNWNGYELNPDYDNYEYDILSYLLSVKMEVAK